MASGTIYGPYTNNNRVEIDWTSTKDTDNNRSSVRLKLYYRHNYTVNFSATKYGSTTINGSTSSFSYTGNVSASSGRHLVEDRTIYVTHNSEGSKSCDLAGVFGLNINYSGSWIGDLSVSGTVTLDKIDRGRMNVRAGGSWRNGQAWVRSSGSWRKAKAVWVRSSGSWRRSE